MLIWPSMSCRYDPVHFFSQELSRYIVKWWRRSEVTHQRQIHLRQVQQESIRTDSTAGKFGDWIGISIMKSCLHRFSSLNLHLNSFKFIYIDSEEKAICLLQAVPPRPHHLLLACDLSRKRKFDGAWTHEPEKYYTSRFPLFTGTAFCPVVSPYQSVNILQNPSRSILYQRY